VRDIRSDIKERLKYVEKELQGIESKVKSLHSLRETLQSMLAAETEQWNGIASEKSPPSKVNGNGIHAEPEPRGTTLSTLLRYELTDHKQLHLKDLAKAAVDRGYPFGGKSPGRVVHFALVGMQTAKLVEQVGKGVWRLHAP
jgi:hypothetical protein